MLSLNIYFNLRLGNLTLLLSLNSSDSLFHHCLELAPLVVNVLLLAGNLLFKFLLALFE